MHLRPRLNKNNHRDTEAQTTFRFTTEDTENSRIRNKVRSKKRRRISRIDTDNSHNQRHTVTEIETL